MMKGTVQDMGDRRLFYLSVSASTAPHEQRNLGHTRPLTFAVTKTALTSRLSEEALLSRNASDQRRVQLSSSLATPEQG